MLILMPQNCLAQTFGRALMPTDPLKAVLRVCSEYSADCSHSGHADGKLRENPVFNRLCSIHVTYKMTLRIQLTKVSDEKMKMKIIYHAFNQTINKK